MADSPRWADTDLSSLRHLNCGGAPVPDTTIATFLGRGLSFSQGYGLTEAAPGALFLPGDMATAKAGGLVLAEDVRGAADLPPLGLALEREAIGRIFVSDDADEGIKAFGEKRKANFKGR